MKRMVETVLIMAEMTSFLAHVNFHLQVKNVKLIVVLMLVRVRMAGLVLKIILLTSPERDAVVLRIVLAILVSFCHVGMVFPVTMAGRVTAKLANALQKMESQNIMALVVICLLHAVVTLVKMEACAQ